MMSDSALNTSSPARGQRAGKLRGTLALAGVLLLGSAVALPAHAQGTKIGFVNTERILRESAPAKAAQSKIESEFKKRDDELQRLSSNLRAQTEKFDKDAPVLSASDRTSRQRDRSLRATTLQRKPRDSQTEYNSRRHDDI